MFDVNSPESVQQALRAMAAQTTQVTAAIVEAKPEQIEPAPAVVPVAEVKSPTQTEPGPLTNEETIQIVQKWVIEDADVEPSERRTFEEMVEALQYIGEGRTTNVPISRFKEIIRTYAPNVLHRIQQETPKPKSYPSELTALVESGVAIHEDGYWLAKRCTNCGQFKTPCCGRTESVSLVRDDGRTLTGFGRQATGLDPIKPPKPPKSVEQITEERKQNWSSEPWWIDFSGTGELQGTKNVKMFIENFLPEGVTLVCGLPKEGKSFLALSIAKALTTGQPLFGRRGFDVPETVPVLFLAAESGDGALKLRCEKFGITQDKTQFICRTLSKGLMLSLDDPTLEQAVRAIKPVIILETLIRFNEGNDEDDATENRKLAEHLFRLIAWGARAVIGIHHSRKDLNKANPTKEAAVRGSSDGLAMADCVWLVMQDEKLYQSGKGPNEIDVVGWGRDFNPVPIRLALTKKSKLPPGTLSFAPGIVSCIDSGDFEWVDRQVREARAKDFVHVVEQLVTEFPTIILKDLVDKSEGKLWEVRKALKQLGYRRGQGDNSKTQWVKAAA